MYRSGAGPLEGIRVLVTRPVEQAGLLSHALASVGATPVVYPTIRIAEPESWAEFDRAFARESHWVTGIRAILSTEAEPKPVESRPPWVVFTSATAVRAALDRVRLDPLCPVAVVGKATAAAFEERGRAPDLVAEDERGSGLARSLAARLTLDDRVILPRAAEGHEDLPEHLRELGISVDVIPVYRTLAVLDAPPPPAFEAATFMSPSALAALVQRWADALTNKLVAVIGPTTKTRADELGVRVDVVAPSASSKALVDALVAYYKGHP